MDSVKDHFTKFRSEIRKQRLWRFYEIKGCLIKYPNSDVWVVGFLQVELSNKKYSAKNVLLDEHLKVIHIFQDIEKLDNLLNQISSGKLLKLGRESASLELMTSPLSYQFHQRAYMAENFYVDYPCTMLIKTGNFTRDLESTEQYLRSVLHKHSPPYQSLRDACSSLLGIDYFGTPAFSPFVSILAPIYAKIEDVKLEKEKILVNLQVRQIVKVDDIKLIVYGEDNLGRKTELATTITKFRQFPESDRIFAEASIDDKSTYFKLVLYYKEQLTEETFIRRIEPPLPPPPLADDTRTKKDEIYQKYCQARNETDRNTKGKLLEQVVREIMDLVPNLKVIASNVNNTIEEIDLLVRNHNREKVWYDFDGMIFIECKNWSSGVGAKDIRNFQGKLRKNRIRAGIFVTVNGVTGEEVDGARGEIKTTFMQEGLRTVVVDGNDLEQIFRCEDISNVIDKKFADVYMWKYTSASEETIVDPIRILKIRLAKGEISKEEYTAIRDIIES
jgi:hypothetical protein